MTFDTKHIKSHSSTPRACVIVHRTSFVVVSVAAMEFDDIFKCEEKSTWSDRGHWKGLVEQLSISEDETVVVNDTKLPPTTDSGRQFQKRLVEDGYALVDKKLDGPLTLKLKEGIAVLHKQGCPATFVLLYDETWEMARLALETLSDATHPSNVFNFDILAWYIDPRENVAGFSPHRDRQPDDTKSSFHDNGQAKYVTMWTALSDATPENSCLYVIPKPFDPGYTEGDCDGTDDEKRGGPLSRALPSKESFQNIRALPRKARQSLLFTHRILHWGSRGNPHSSVANEPRIAISFVCSDPSFEEPYLKDPQFPPTFETRLLLVCAQLLIYYQRFSLSKNCIRACYEYVKEHSDELSKAYRNKITVEFVKAMKEADSSEPSVANGKVSGQENEKNSDEEVLEAMLDAEEGGYGEFQDDFDEMNEESLGQGGSEDDDSEEEGEGESFLFGKRPPETTINRGGNRKKQKDEEH